MQLGGLGKRCQLPQCGPGKIAASFYKVFTAI